MRRAGLIFFHLAAGVSLMLCVAATALWGWSRSPTVQITRRVPLSVYSLTISRGGIRAEATHRFNPLNPYPDNMLGWTFKHYPNWDLVVLTPRIFPTARQPIPGFFFAHLAFDTYDFSLVQAPMWFVILLFALLPLVAGVRLARRRRRARRLAAGCCIACGYDLRASPERCPECGRAADAPVGAAR